MKSISTTAFLAFSYTALKYFLLNWNTYYGFMFWSISILKYDFSTSWAYLFSLAAYSTIFISSWDPLSSMQISIQLFPAPFFYYKVASICGDGGYSTNVGSKLISLEALVYCTLLGFFYFFYSSALCSVLSIVLSYLITLFMVRVPSCLSLSYTFAFSNSSIASFRLAFVLSKGRLMLIFPALHRQSVTIPYF